MSGKRTIRRGTAAILAGVVTLSGCWWGGDDDDDEPIAEEPSTTVATGAEDPDPVVTVAGLPEATAATPLGIRLSEGQAVDTGAEPVAIVEGAPLTPEQVQAVIDRLPAWSVPETDREEFDRPPQTLLPPLVGETIEGVFPPPPVDAPDEPAGGPLQVVRYQPEGPVDIAPFLSVTFDQPMVPLATLEQLDASEVPVVVTPAVEGRWRWIGTRTLRFELVPGELDRLPGSTDYTVEVPAGTRSASGAELAETVSWTFSTPPVSVTDFVGDDESLPLTPVFVAVFDQRVDAQAVIDTIRLTAGGEDRPLRLAADSEVEADDAARRAVEQALPDRTVAFRANEPLPPDTDLSISIGPGTPSAEGPKATDTAETFTGRTFGQLEIVRTTCDWGDGCTPGTPFSIEFSNPLEPTEFSADLVTIEPAIAQLGINVYGSVVEITGATEGRTTYEVTFGGALQDVFGQTLGEPETVEFDVGPAKPAFRGFDRQWITTDPTAELPSVTVTSINHDEVRVRAWAVSPANVREFREYLDDQYADEGATPPESWSLVLDEVVEIDAEEDRFVETPIDLTGAFAQSGSQIVVRVETTLDLGPDDEAYWRNVPTVAWVQRTTLGIDAFLDGRNLVIWTTDLTTGETVGRVPVELIGDGRVATTGSDGLAEVELGSDGILGLWASDGERRSFLPSDWWDGWREEGREDEDRWYVFDDRGIYRPGETVRITGWVRNFAWSSDAQLALWDGATDVAYQVWDPQGVELASGTTALNRLGGFNLSVEIPEGANLGQAWVELSLEGVAVRGNGNHSFQIQEFRRPEFEVTARTESPAPYYAARPATVAVDAEYFAGGPLPDADVNWLVTTRETSYRPPNWDEYVFGIWQPWWWFGDDVAARGLPESDICFGCGPFGDVTYEEFAGTTDANGTHYLQIEFDGATVDLPTTVTAEATVFDVDRQAWASRTDLLVHAAEHYVGLRTDRPFVERGTPIRVDAVVTDVDGAIVAGRAVEVVAGRVEWVQSGGEWTEQLADEQRCTVTSTADATDASMRCEFTTEVGGQYRITARVEDDGGHVNRTELTQWVSGGEGRPTRGVEQDQVTIVPDAETYQPGDTAELLVQAPFSPAHGVVTVVRGEILSTESFTAEDGSAVIEIPIEDAWIPNVTVQVDMVGTAQRTGDDGTALPDLPERAAYATGQISLSIPPITRALDVTATPAAATLEPGDDTSVTIAVTDAAGEPVEGADVAVVVVDEAVLSLTGYELADPLDVFYTDVWSNLTSQYVRRSVVLARADLVEGEIDNGRLAAPSTSVADGGAGDDAAEESAEEPAADEGAAGVGSEPQIELRNNFDALAVYAPSQTTGADGTVTVDVPLPDSLTRYRVMAVAIDGADQFGKGESTITARLPLMVRPSAPRFLNFGDRFELPVVLQNQTDEPLEVDVALETANLALTGSSGQRVTVPANDRVEVRFPATTDQVGTARFRVAAVSGDLADATSGSLPVYTPATSEAFATYGVVDSDGGLTAVGQPIVTPTGVFPEFGGLEVGTSSTAVQSLTDAVLYLVDFDYQSTDGYASRIMAVAALRDILEAFDAEGLPDPEQLDVRVRTDIERLAALQNDNGGWPWFQKGRESIPFQSIQATHALVLAQAADHPVPQDTLDRALEHLASIEEHFPSTYSEELRNTLSSYALYVRNEAGRGDSAKAAALYDRVGDDLDLDALAWLWPSIADADARAAIERRFENAAVETAGAAVFATDYAEDAFVIAQSERRTDGIALDALITETPESDLIPKVVNGLIGNQIKGRWRNVYENSFILLALHRYFATFEDVTPDFVARVWLGDLYAAESVFDGRTTVRVNTLVPMDEVIGRLAETGESTIVIANEGTGRLYYRLGLTYAPDDLQLDPRDEGFVVERTYEAVDDPADVTRDADGTWRIAAGAKVRVRLTMVADAQRTSVALVDPLPAGLEPVNPALAVSSTTPPEEGDGEPIPLDCCWFWGWNWFEHQNLRDDRVEAFSSYLPGGTYEYTYIARATTPGQFVVPPTKAEEMYAPEVFGRSSSASVVVE
jgi:alpha-2-macroglobulin